MDMNELVELAARLNAAYEAHDTLVKNTEVLAEQSRKYIRSTIVDFYHTKIMLLAVANSCKIRATHKIGVTFWGNTYRNVEAGYKDGLILLFEHNGRIYNERRSGEVTYGCAGERTEYVDCSLTWSCGSSPDIEFDLTREDWMRGKTMEEALRYFDSHIWSAEGYAQLKRKAALTCKRSKIMKDCLEAYANSIIDKVKADTANLVAV